MENIVNKKSIKPSKQGNKFDQTIVFYLRGDRRHKVQIYFIVHLYKKIKVDLESRAGFVTFDKFLSSNIMLYLELDMYLK